MSELTQEEQEMLEDEDVRSHIQERNEELRKRAIESGHMVFSIDERIADRYDNVYEFEFEMALNSYSDGYKEKHGIRPSLKRDEWTLSDVEEKINQLSDH